MCQAEGVLVEASCSLFVGYPDFQLDRDNGGEDGGHRYSFGRVDTALSDLLIEMVAGANKAFDMRLEQRPRPV